MQWSIGVELMVERNLRGQLRLLFTDRKDELGMGYPIFEPVTKFMSRDEMKGFIDRVNGESGCDTAEGAKEFRRRLTNISLYDL